MKTHVVPREWKAGRLADVIAGVATGVSVNSEDRPRINGEIGVLKVSCVLTGQFDSAENKAVLRSELSRVREHVKSGRVLVSRANTPNLVGASAYLWKTIPDLFLSDKLWQLSPRLHVDGRWVAAVVASRKFRAQVTAAATGSSLSMKNISQEAYLAIPILIPPLNEQRRIADVLDTWGNAINKLTRQLTRQQQRFAFLHSSLIHGERHLHSHKGAWCTQPLRMFLKPIRRPAPKPAEPYTAISIRSHGKGTFQRVVERPAAVDMDVLFRVSERDLIVNITFAWEGAIALAKPQDEGCLVSHRFPTFTIDENIMNRDFLGYAINDERFFYSLGIVSPGGAGRNRVLDQSDFLDIRLSIPPLSEQKAIARVLNDAAQEINLIQQKLLAVRKQRDALVTELVSGRMRVLEAEQVSRAVEN
jgi:type I restriction enzyme S subunit